MKLLTAIAAALLIGTVASAQDNIPRVQEQFHAILGVPCADAPEFYIAGGSEYYNETILFSGLTTNILVISEVNEMPVFSVLAVLVNQDTGTFSISITFDDGVSCLLTSGTDFTPYSGQRPQNDSF